MAGFEITPQGIVEMSERRPISGPIEAILEHRESHEAQDFEEAPEPAQPRIIQPGLDMTQRAQQVRQAFQVPNVGKIDVVKLARARAKELKAKLREAKAWAKELAELERLIAASKGKSLGVVRNIESSRRVS